MGTVTKENGRIEVAEKQILELYKADELPWIIGYSGGKDSSTVLQLVWNAVAAIPEEHRTKTIYVISTDTLVENPIVATWVERSLKKINEAASIKRLGITAHRLTPKLEDRFWVNLIGRGYPAPRPMFRWCTSRLKINASTDFIRNVASERGEAILFLGTRSGESQARKKSMERVSGSTRELLSRNTDPRLDRVWVFSVISDWTSDDVWEYLIENENPWGHSNQELFHLYKGATPDAECPLVVDKSTPSCGDSRFGCYVCTMVDKDKSMSAMIQNNDDKKWMIPLAQFREKKLDTSDDFPVRDFRRMDRRIQKFDRGGVPSLLHGPYKQSYREELLAELLKAQTEIQNNAPKGIDNFSLISIEELEEIRRIWIEEKHEIEDNLPRIYQQVTGKKYPAPEADDQSIFSLEDLQILKELCANPDDPDHMLYQMLREMLQIEQSYRGAYRRTGIFDLLEKSVRDHAFHNPKEALEFLMTNSEQSDQAVVEHESEPQHDLFDEGSKAKVSS
jgi:DNA sulfur modification protein DndC